MDKFFNIVAIVLILIMGAYVVIKLFSKPTKRKFNSDVCDTPEDLYNKWSSQSYASKIESAYVWFVIILIISFIGFIIYWRFNVQTWVDSKVDIDTADEILFELKKIAYYIVGFFTVGFLIGFISFVLSWISCFDLAKWLTKNGINDHTMMEKINSESVFKDSFGNAFLLQKHPNFKKTFYIFVGVRIATIGVFVFSCYNLINKIYVRTYELLDTYELDIFEAYKDLILSFDTFLILASIIAIIAVPKYFKAMTVKKQAEMQKNIYIEYTE